VCCSVLQGVAVSCQRVATDNRRQQETTRETSEGLLQCVAVCCSVLQCVAVSCQRVARDNRRQQETTRETNEGLLQCVSVCCSVLQCVAVCCSERTSMTALQEFGMGWLRLVGSLKLQVSFAEYSLFYRALLPKRPIILRSLLIVTTPYISLSLKHSSSVGISVCHTHTPIYQKSLSKETYDSEREIERGGQSWKEKERVCAGM